MNRLALLAALALPVSLPIAARADDASRHAKAEEMVTLLHTDRMVQQVSVNLIRQLSTAGDQIIGPNPTQAKKDELAALEKKFSDMIDTQVGWKVMEPALVDIYASTFTDEELTAIVTFYKSPAGNALVEKLPAVNGQATQLIQSKLSALKPQIMQMYQDFQKSQATPSPSAPTNDAPAASPSTVPGTPK